MDSWTWITRGGVAVALVLSAGNTGKLIVDARRQYRERRDKKAAERQLVEVVDMLRAGGRGSVMCAKAFEDRLRLGVELGVERGVVLRLWRGGTMILALARDPAPPYLPSFD